MEQEAEPSQVTAVSAPAGEDDNAASVEIDTAASAPQSPSERTFYDEELFELQRNPFVPVYQVWIPDYTKHWGPWDVDRSWPIGVEPDPEYLTIGEACKMDRAIRQWLTKRSKKCVHTLRFSDLVSDCYTGRPRIRYESVPGQGYDEGYG